ncbi:actin-binding WH2 domain-containing protein [Oculatella sp. LEGE 06141]|uniref:actin-binding WH2 domain-containing protein n=1 Tax=Oculatella sp. LEGE 06141 TaxID=1828648 RepID=UPI001882B510|nr:actin-binding WH2 domain-containing protein [Oculatella sp. LEGE 06141]MBE9179089.1 actin-binding WH2 domain-containing protein [Oculatella sp. LEGE 06141]
MNHFVIMMSFLRDRQRFLDEVYKGIHIETKVISLLICSSSFLALYGGIIGASSSWPQILASAIKLPALYLITLLICLPTLYFFDVVAGSNRTFGQYLALLLASTSVISIMLFAFAPVTLFFHLSVNDYLFFKLVNVLIFTLTGMIGINFFYRGIMYVASQDVGNPNRSKIVKAWLVLYGLVGSQLGWTLRPFFGAPGEPFALFRNLESNFYLNVLKSIGEALGLS